MGQFFVADREGLLSFDCFSGFGGSRDFRRWTAYAKLEPVSGQIGLRFLGKVISGCRDGTAITSVKAERENPETKSTGGEGANTWVFGAAPGNLRRAATDWLSNEDSNHRPARLGMRDLREEIATARSSNPVSSGCSRRSGNGKAVCARASTPIRSI
jgi:hypothetical protein